MGDLWAVIGALAVVVLPIALAWWLLGRPSRSSAARPDPRGNMHDKKER